jgi:hypothetical protein
VSCDRFVAEIVQLALRDIALELAIPELGIERGELFSEERQLRR